MFVFKTRLSEAVLNAQLTTQTEVIIVVGGQEGNLTIDTNLLGDINTNTSFTRELSLGVLTVYSDDGGSALDIVASVLAESAFITNVKVGCCT